VGRGKHCSPEMRNFIIKLKNEGKTYKKIENIFGCLSTMIFNAIRYKLKPENRGGKLETIAVDDRQIVRSATIIPFASAGQIKKELSLTISLRTLRRRLEDKNLFARSQSSESMFDVHLSRNFSQSSQRRPLNTVAWASWFGHVFLMLGLFRYIR